MFNNRIVIAQKELFISIFNKFEKNYADYRAIIDKYNSVFRPIAAWMLARDSDEFAINDIVSHLTEYINIKKLNPANIKVTRNDVVINGESSPNLEEFINFVHGNFPVVRQQVVQKRDENLEHIPVLTGDGIKIYKVEQAQDSKELAADTSWCIAYKGPNNMWQSYRSNQAATFFIVWDENPPTPNQRKVALQYNARDVNITDIVNRTGPTLTNDISFEYNGQTITGRDIPTYLTYLRSKGVNIDATTKNPETGDEEKILKNKPITPEEKLLTDLSGFAKSFKNSSVESPFTEDDIKMWSTGKFELKFPPSQRDLGYFIEDNGKYKAFLNGVTWRSSITIPEEFVLEKTPLIKSPDKDLFSSITIQTDDAKTYLSKFIGTGWIMPDNIFNYVFETPGGNDILVQYVNTGLPLPKTQTDKISRNRQLLNSYLKQQLAGVELGHNNDFAFLEYIDTNNEEVKQLVLNKAGSTFLNNFPEKWSVALPQIGLRQAQKDAEVDFKDEFVNKLAIIKGVRSVYKKYPTLENTRLLLHVPEAIKPLLDKARNEKYPMQMFEHINDIKHWSHLWYIVPEEFKDNPEFIIYKAADKAANLDEKEYDKLVLQPENLLNNLSKTIYLMNDHFEVVNDKDKNNVEFWKSSIENFDKLVGTIFKNIHLFHPVKDDDDDEDYDNDDEEENPDKQYEQLAHFICYLPKEVFSSQEIANSVKSNASTDLKNILFSNANNIETYELYFKNIKEFLSSGQAWRSDIYKKPNTFIVNLIENNNDENLLFELVKGMTLNFWGLSNLEYLTSWYPEILNKFSDDTLLKIFNSNGQIMSDNMANTLRQVKPKFFIDWIPYFKTTAQFKQQNPELFQNFSKEKTQIITNLNLEKEQARERLRLPQAPQPNQIEENPEVDEEEEEEDVLASSKLMLKIAQKLDLKKKYRLADKLTYILGKSNV
jgi:hypothetical protein